MTEVCYDEMGAAAPVGVVGGMVERRLSEIQEERRRWALKCAVRAMAHTGTDTLRMVRDIEAIAKHFLLFAETGSFGDPA